MHFWLHQGRLKPRGFSSSASTMPGFKSNVSFSKLGNPSDGFLLAYHFVEGHPNQGVPFFFTNMTYRAGGGGALEVLRKPGFAVCARDFPTT